MARLAGFDLSILDKLLPSTNGHLEEAPLKKVKIAPKKTHKNKNENDEAPYTFFKVLTGDKNDEFVDMNEVVSPPSQKTKTRPVKETSLPKEIAKPVKGEKINIAVKNVEKPVAKPSPPKNSIPKTSTPKASTESQTPKKSGKYVVQAGSFRKIESANRLVAKLKSKGYSAYWKEKDVEGKKWFRVYLGSFADHDAALAMVQKARAEEKLDPMIAFLKD